MRRFLCNVGRLAALALPAALLMLAPAPGVSADLQVVLADGPFDAVTPASSPILGMVGRKGGEVLYVAVITGPAQDVTFTLPTAPCAGLPPYFVGPVPVEITPPDSDAYISMVGTAVKIEHLTIPSSGSVEVRVGPVSIKGMNTQACCTRAAVADASGLSKPSRPTEAAGAACGSGYSGFFVVDPAAPPVAAD